MRINENGRSMVEMLGVLAIVGILSVGGVYAYMTSMIKYRMNEVVQTASMMALLSKSGNAGEGICIKLSDYNPSLRPGGVNVDILARPGPGTLTDVKIKFADGDPDHKQCAFIENAVSNDGNAGYVVFCDVDEINFDCDD